VQGRPLPVPPTQCELGKAASASTWPAAQSALRLRRLLPAHLFRCQGSRTCQAQWARTVADRWACSELATAGARSSTEHSVLSLMALAFEQPGWGLMSAGTQHDVLQGAYTKEAGRKRAVLLDKASYASELHPAKCHRQWPCSSRVRCGWCLMGKANVTKAHPRHRCFPFAWCTPSLWPRVVLACGF
jgi:hypothetical protein